MSNLPLGADNDIRAPYNINETTFRFDLSVKGIAWYEYCGSLSVDEALDTIKYRLKETLMQLGDIEIKDFDLSIY